MYRDRLKNTFVELFIDKNKLNNKYEFWWIIEVFRDIILLSDNEEMRYHLHRITFISYILYLIILYNNIYNYICVDNSLKKRIHYFPNICILTI